MNTFQKFIHQRTYARYLPEEKRRETWIETCNRYARHILGKVPLTIPNEANHDLCSALASIKTLDVMPSMRLMHSAGEAHDQENLTGYNCGYLPIDSLESFSELLYVLMCGTGCGFSVEHKEIMYLPYVQPDAGSTRGITFEDSREGWALGFLEALSLMWKGVTVVPDVSKVRPKDAPLKTFGGRASGPGPLLELLEFCQKVLYKASSRPIPMLRPLEVYDICCKIAQCVISGGVRRSATICLFSEEDEEMLVAKTPEAIAENPWRCFSNNSVVTEDPSVSLVTKVMSLAKATGEPGIFNRRAAINKAGTKGRSAMDFGCNPCGEIILRPRQLCNLTEVVCRPKDTVEDLMNKVEYATILGTIQSSFTRFNEKVLSSQWRTNSEDERLLGVSLTGLCDCPDVLRADHLIDMLREHARLTNVHWAKLLGIQESLSITCIKPSGTVSQLVDSSSGLHPRFSEYYFRNVMVSAGDPLGKLLKSEGIPFIQDKYSGNPVFVFPVKSPEKSLTVSKQTLKEAFELNRRFQDLWCDHNVSQTIMLGEDQWEEALGRLMANFEKTVGITFFPKLPNGNLQWAPYEEISRDEWFDSDMLAPKVDFEKLPEFETEDTSESAHEFACVGGSCSL